MNKKWLFIFLILTLSLNLSFSLTLSAQVTEDSLENAALARMVTLSEVVVRNNLNVPDFINRVKKDTTFYKAFRNLRVLNFTSLNSIVMKDKKGNICASLGSKTSQTYRNGCRSMKKDYENITGDMLDNNGGYNYYTAELYASLFFTNGTVCGENNNIKNLNPKSKSGIDKRKEQLKMLFFNPGKKIPGIPLMGEKSNIFDPRIADDYDYTIDYTEYNGRSAYVFSIKAKPSLSGSQRNQIVFDNMTTWFDYKDFEILGRNYDLSYNTGAYDFDVHMEVQLAKIGRLLVPSVMRYYGNWHILTKGRERGIFTATLYGFH
jgi:hypothetical protein